MIDSAADPSCAQHRVADTEWIETDAATRKAIERWTLDRCGRQVRYRITFAPAPQGGMNFAIQVVP